MDAVVKARLNILISGGTGSGKTTTLNIMSGYIPSDERIITIEDSAELQLQQEHVARLETRPPNVEGKGEITQRELVRNSLRMRPERIIIGIRPEDLDGFDDEDGCPDTDNDADTVLDVDDKCPSEAEDTDGQVSARSNIAWAISVRSVVISNVSNC